MGTQLNILPSNNQPLATINPYNLIKLYIRANSNFMIVWGSQLATTIAWPLLSHRFVAFWESNILCKMISFQRDKKNKTKQKNKRQTKRKKKKRKKKIKTQSKTKLLQIDPFDLLSYITK